MSTSDGRPLTRRQLRELRQTGQTPILTEDDIAADRDARAVEEETAAPAIEEPSDENPDPASDDGEATDEVEELEVVPAVAEEEREEAQTADAEPAEPVDEPVDEPVEPVDEPAELVDAEPTASATPDDRTSSEGESAPSPAPAHPVLTRRQLREQERLRTNATPTVNAEQAEPETIEATIVTDEVPQTAAPATVDVELVEQTPEAPVEEAPVEDEAPAASPTPRASSEAPTAEDAGEQQATLRPDFGEGVEVEAITHSPASFDELLTQPQETSGSSSAPSTLVLDEIPATAALSAPITATGELLITSSHKLPEGFGSSGAAKGTTDGREVDAVLIDGEIPLSSSPTPIAASDAVSTSKSPGEVIRPPAPEKNHKLILTLGITAGGLGIAVVAAVVIAYATGVFG
ncbi:hypothetical protein GCM10017576_04060 [Microbacterium barkeri]|uniref:Uncharacterized protein n=1 Tax=Microbacterium barkeri TaxID=33917 RepID=A0A9W6H115_9MICO|nr:hypothetical protein [Microbacterium barkeri]MDR6876160.1 hypothetical protein [Microbacterium barkeri]GLJ60277.1 hypothetical protein GCM10017576_04060 [Microbacterium barkeri]